MGAELVHSTTAERPLVHMVLWDENAKAEFNGRVTVAGDEKQPVHVRVRHGFNNEHQQVHRFETALQSPVHHALQMRTPLQVRFCNTWQIASTTRSRSASATTASSACTSPAPPSPSHCPATTSPARPP